LSSDEDVGVGSLCSGLASQSPTLSTSTAAVPNAAHLSE
jgi:hypothetical protein